MQRAGEEWNSNHTGIALDILKTYLPNSGQPDVRDFAWWAIWNEYHDNSRVIGTHEGGATAVACTSMSPYAAFTGGKDAKIKIWSIPEGKPIGELNGHTLGPIQSLELSPDESLLLSAAEDGTVRVWDVRTHEEKMVFREHSGWVATARFAPDGKKIASAGADCLIHIWDISSGEVLQTLKGHEDTVRAVAFHPNYQHTQLLVSSSEDQTIRAWNYVIGVSWNSDGKFPDGMLPARNPGWSDAIEFYDDGRSIFVASIGTWKMEGGDRGTQEFCFADVNPRYPRIRSARCLLDGRILWAMQDSSLRLFKNEDAPHDTPSRVLRGHLAQDVMDVALFPNDEGFISVCENGEIRVWRPSALKPAVQIEDRDLSSPNQLDWQETAINHAHTYGKYLIGATDDVAGDWLWMEKIPTKNPLAFTFATHPDKTRAWVWLEGKLICYRIPGGELLWTSQNESKLLEDIAEPADARLLQFDPTGRFAALFYGSHGALVSADTSDLRLKIDLPALVNTQTFLRHHSSLVIGLNDGSIRCLNLNSLNAGFSVGHQLDHSGVKDFSFSVDESRIAILLNDNSFGVWTFPQFEPICRMQHLVEEDLHRTYLADSGETLIVIPSSMDRFDFWNIRSRKRHVSLHLETARAAVMNPERTKFAVGTERGIRFIDGGRRPQGGTP